LLPQAVALRFQLPSRPALPAMSKPEAMHRYFQPKQAIPHWK
jgi:hypothetical protein